MIELTTRAESWPIARTFRISRGEKTEAQVVVVELRSGRFVGRGECVPYGRYGETVSSVLEQLSGLGRAGAIDRETITSLPAGAARNALDCALWDLEAKGAGMSVNRLADLPEPGPITTSYTLSVADPAELAVRAKAEARRPILKVKAAGNGDLARVEAVHHAAPHARIIVDANEAWSVRELVSLMPRLANLGVALIEQPLPAGEEALLASVAHTVPICADESVHDRASLAALVGRYEYVNIKLDKTGGLTEALATRREARRLGFGIVVGCMVCTSLAVAPALLLAADADYVDLDGPLLLAQDREGGVTSDGQLLYPAAPELWGGGS